MTENHEPLSDEERAADKAIQMLLSAPAQEAMIQAINEQYMVYAPLAGVQSAASRFKQLWRVVFEFTVGMPVKFFNYWRRDVRLMLTEDAGLVAVACVAVVAIPLSILRYLKGFATALWCCCIARNMLFASKADVIQLIRGG